jgi:hypothetical protein
MIVAFSAVSIFQVRLPVGDDFTYVLPLIIYIRDQLDCITQFNLTSVIVIPDFDEINDLIKIIQTSSNQITANSIVQLLASGNQNIVAQVLTSFSQQLNKMNSENLAKAVSSKLDLIKKRIEIIIFCFVDGIPATSISISSLNSQSYSGVMLFDLVFFYNRSYIRHQYHLMCQL